jgi:hypothetical protein
MNRWSFSKNVRKSRRKQNIIIPNEVVSWFFKNFEINENSHVKKETIYINYCNHFKNPVAINAFGKYIKKLAPNRKLRRLKKSFGVSIPCYEGIGNLHVKEQPIVGNNLLYIICNEEEILKSLKEFADSL